MRKILQAVLTMLAVAILVSAAKPEEKEAEEPVRSYRHTYYDDHNGLSQWHATKMLQDKRGFMWIATWNGLNRFDGYEFAVFKSLPGDNCSLASDRIRNMLMGDDGNIYCNINSRIWRFNMKTYKFEEPDPEIAERYMARMQYDTSAWERKPMNVCGTDFPDVRQILTDQQKNVWVMCTYGVEKFVPTPPVAPPLTAIPQDIVRCMYRDRKGRIWITTRDKKIVALVNQNAELIGYLAPDGTLRREQVSFGRSIYTIMEQRNGVMWFGCKPEGLFRVRETSDGVFSMENFAEGTPQQAKEGSALNCGYVYDIKEDKKGRLWIATQGGGLNIVEKPMAEKLTFSNYNNVMKGFPQANSQLRRLKIVGDSIVLATSTEGLLVIRGINGKPATMTFTVHVREAQRESSLGCSALMDMVIDRKGRFLFSTESGGVDMLLTKNLTATRFDFEHFNTSNGMGSDAALAMTEVGDEILVQCNNQVTRLNVDTKVKENFNDRFFSVESRFSDAEPLLLKNGVWLLSMETGVLLMPEQSFHQRKYIPRLVLTSFAVPGRKVDYTAEMHDTIKLNSEERDITIAYASLDYADNAHIKYVTRMREERSWWEDDDETEWTTPSESRTTSFYNLSPGTYTFEVRSTNAEGLWVDNVRKITVVVTPHFSETGIAYLIYIMLFIAAIVGITYTVLYIRHLRRQREENLQAYLKLFNSQGKSKETEETGQEQQAEEAAPATIISHLKEEDELFMNKLTEFVDKNLGDSDIGVDDMADATATSRSSLNRKMKQILGVTPADFLREARMKRACHMLKNTSRGVNDVAYSCGFSDPKYFSKVFKASIGMSPSDYRMQAQE